MAGERKTVTGAKKIRIAKQERKRRKNIWNYEPDDDHSQVIP